jgi:putative chitinase
VKVVSLPANHVGIGGGYDLHGTAAVALEGATAYLKNSGIDIGEVPRELRFDPSKPIAVYTEGYQTARNGDVLRDQASGRPATVWRLDENERLTTLVPAPRALPDRLDHPDHPGHAVFRQAQDGMHKIDAQHGRVPDQRSDSAAACLAATSLENGMRRIDHVALGTDASKLFAIEGALNSPFKKVCSVPTVESLNTPMEQTTARWPEALQQVEQQQMREQAQAQQRQLNQAQEAQQSRPGLAR